MNQPVLFLTVFIFLIIPIDAQNANHSPINPSIEVVISVLSVMFLLLLIILVYAKFCYVGIPDILSIQNNLNRSIRRTSTRLLGLDKTVIQTLPFFTFSSLKGSKEGLECAVCLSRFQNADVLRLLPNCKHAFHVRCIDTWLEAHSNCPLCRYKFHVEDFTNSNTTNIIRYPRDLSNLSYNQSLHEISVDRVEQNPVAENMRKFNHKIIVRDFVDRSRWSDVKSSDLLFLNSEMISFASSKRFSPMNESVTKNNGSGRFRRSNSLTSNNNLKSLNVKMKRSVSDRPNDSRFKEFFVNNSYKMEECLLNGNGEREERMKRLWFSLARRTVQLFGGTQEKVSKELEVKRFSSNV